MDYILRKLDRKICFLEGRDDKDKLRLYYQVKYEYQLLFLLAYLWNKNYERLDENNKEYILGCITEPSIGQIVDISRRLDIDNEVFSCKPINNVINSYPKFRNEKIGHGYSFEDDSKEFISALKQMSNTMSDRISVINEVYDYVYIEKEDNGIFRGISYKSNGEYDNWMLPSKDCKLEVQNLYLQNNSCEYFKMTPFILIESDEEIYLFRSVVEKLIGKFKYNQLFNTGSVTREWDFFSTLNIKCDQFKKIGANGTIINLFDYNYEEHKYIENNALKKSLEKFITNNSFVCATLWGHGGVGKTAAVQNLCEGLQLTQSRKFDYILFASAKDRYYDYHTGSINAISCEASYVAIIKLLNKLIRNEEIFDEDAVIKCESKYLLIIDDFETFSQTDKAKIEEFVTKLDIKRQKVIITTRANTVIGFEIKTNELDEENTSVFLAEIFEQIFKSDIRFKLTQNIRKKIHDITSGRPIFILQLAYILAQKGIEYATTVDLKSSKQAIEFLYGRIYEYLKPAAQKIFSVMGVIADTEDMTNLIEKLKYILSMENDAQFDDNIAEIEKLRLIEIIDNKFYKVYSKEILDIMKKYFDLLEDKGTINKRILQVSKDPNLDNDNALLANANASRYSKAEQEVVGLYRQILKRKACSKAIKVTALLNLSEYLFNDKGNKEGAIDVLAEFYVEFKDEADYVKMYSQYTWAQGAKEKSVELLLEYFSQKRSFKEDRNLELFGYLITNRVLYWLELREETKLGHRFDEITDDEYSEQFMEQKSNFEDIAKKQGHVLIGFIKNKDFTKMSSGARQSLITALYQYVEICIRLHDWDNGNYICNVLGNKLAKYNYGLDFEGKQKRIKAYEREERQKKLKVYSR